MSDWLKTKSSLLLHGGIIVLVLIFFLGIKDMSLIGTLGFESANLFVLFFGPLFCLVAIFYKNKKSGRSFSRIFLYEFLWALGSLSFYTLLLLYNGVLHQSCSPGAGFIAYFLTLAPPILLNISLGCLLAALVPHVGMRLVIFFVAYPAYVMWVFWSWWQEASFRLVTHASIILNSDLMKGGSLNLGMAGFRIATALIALAIIIFGIKFVNFSRPQLWRSQAKSPFLNFFLVAFLLALASIIHWQSWLSIGKNRHNLEEDYSLVMKDQNITLRAHPDFISEQQAKDILAEARLYEQALNQSLAPLSNAPLTIWLHADDEQKFAYTGAKNVHFALPSRREIHIAETSVPHPILGHELAHIYVGEYATTFLGVPGKFGFIPNMALTEGIAMLLTPALVVENDLSMFEQAQAFYQAGLKVDILKLFAISPTQFALYNPRSSYVFAGAFLEFVLSTKTEPTQHLKETIKAGSISPLFVDDAERDDRIAAFYQRLQEPISPYAVAWAKKYFVGQSILGNNCQEIFRREKASFSKNMMNDNLTSALASVSMLPKDVQLSLLIDAKDRLLSAENYAQAEQIISVLLDLVSPEDPRFNELKLDRLESLIFQGRYNDAKSALESINKNFLSLSAQRAVGILTIALEQEPERAQPLYKIIFVKNSSLVSSAAQLGVSVGENSISRTSLFCLSSYLYARLLMRERNHKKALEIIEELLKNAQSLPAFLMHEITLMFAETHYNLKNYLQAKEIYLALEQESVNNAEKIIIKDFLWRIEAIQSPSR